MRPLNDEGGPTRTAVVNPYVSPRDPLTIAEGYDEITEERQALAAIRAARSEQMAALNLPEPYRCSQSEVARLAAWDRMLREHPGRELQTFPHVCDVLVRDPNILDPRYPADFRKSPVGVAA